MGYNLSYKYFNWQSILHLKWIKYLSGENLLFGVMQVNLFNVYYFINCNVPARGGVFHRFSPTSAVFTRSFYPTYCKVGLNDNYLHRDKIYSQAWYLESICYISFIKFVLYYLVSFFYCITILSFKLVLIHCISSNSVLSLHLSMDACQLLLLSVYRSSIIIDFVLFNVIM